MLFIVIGYFVKCVFSCNCICFYVFFVVMYLGVVVVMFFWYYNNKIIKDVFIWFDIDKFVGILVFSDFVIGMEVSGILVLFCYGWCCRCFKFWLNINIMDFCFYVIIDLVDFCN